MNKLLPNLLIIFALALCGLNAFQWVKEAKLQAEKAKLGDDLYKEKQTVQSLQATIKRAEADILRLDTLKTELTGTVKTNRQEIVSLSRQVDRLEKEVDVDKKQIEAYKEAMDRANQSIKKQNDDIRRQNEDLKQLAEERNAAVVKYNKLASDYNDLVKQFNKLQEDFSKYVAAVTNAAAAPKK